MQQGRGLHARGEAYQADWMPTRACEPRPYLYYCYLMSLLKGIISP
jgi:hypothetical protein